MNKTSFFVSMTVHSLTHACVATLMPTNTGYINYHVLLISYKAYVYKIKLVKILIYDTLLLTKIS